eukprot:g5548.t1
MESTQSTASSSTTLDPGNVEVTLTITPNVIKKMSKSELQQHLRELGQRADGSRATLVRRLTGKLPTEPLPVAKLRKQHLQKDLTIFPQDLILLLDSETQINIECAYIFIFL